MRLATSLAHLGANVTGCSSRAADLEAKRLQLLKELVPGLSRVAILFNYTNQFAIENKLPSVYAFRESSYGGLRCHTPRTLRVLLVWAPLCALCSASESASASTATKGRKKIGCLLAQAAVAAFQGA
jgi:hypothetical protein